jgi:hypothetical protein
VAKQKYGNKKTTIDGVEFDSKKEAARWQELRLLERAGKISELERQVVFELAKSVQYSGKRATPALRYVADFAYFENTETCGSVYTVEDVKGVKTSAYKIKKHLMLAVHKIEVLET